MTDPNNRPGGPALILTAKSANKVQFFDAGTLAKTGEIDMPASTHELIRSPAGDKIYASVYGGGIFGKNKDPDRRIAVIDLATKKLERTIDVGETVAPHSVMMDAGGTLWSTAELGNAVLAIDPDSGQVERIALGGSPHWIAVSHATGKLFASFKTKEAVAVVDTAARRMIGTIAIPHGAEGIAVSPDGWALFVCAHRKGVVHVFDTRTHELQPHAGDRGRAGRGQPAPPRAGVAGRTLRLRVVARRQLRRHLRRLHVSADRGLPDAEGAHGLRLRRRRPTRLSVLPRCRDHAGVRIGERPPHAAIRNRGRL